MLLKHPKDNYVRPYTQDTGSWADLESVGREYYDTWIILVKKKCDQSLYTMV